MNNVGEKAGGEGRGGERRGGERRREGEEGEGERGRGVLWRRWRYDISESLVANKAWRFSLLVSSVISDISDRAERGVHTNTNEL